MTIHVLQMYNNQQSLLPFHPSTYLGQKNYYSSDQVPISRRGSGATPPTTDEQDYYGVPPEAVGRDYPYPTTLNHGGDAFYC